MIIQNVNGKRAPYCEKCTVTKDVYNSYNHGKKETLNIKYTTASPCIIKQVIRMYVSMFPIAGLTAGPNGLTFFEGTHGG